jgi:hypothetical protein
LLRGLDRVALAKLAGPRANFGVADTAASRGSTMALVPPKTRATPWSSVMVDQPFGHSERTGSVTRRVADLEVEQERR